MVSLAKRHCGGPTLEYADGMPENLDAALSADLAAEHEYAVSMLLSVVYHVYQAAHAVAA